MYSYKQKMKAINLYYQYGNKLTAVIRKLNYPHNRHTLAKWVKEYELTGTLKKKYHRQYKYSKKQKIEAVNHYLNHGKNMSYTCKSLGFPNRHYLKEWIDEFAPNERKTHIVSKTVINYSLDQKINAVTDLCVRALPVVKMETTTGISRTSYYKWKKELLGKEYPLEIGKEKADQDIITYETELKQLKKTLYRQKIELDILKQAEILLRKDQGVSQKLFTNREITIIINTLRALYPLTDLLTLLGISKSSYYYQKSAINKGDKYKNIRSLIKTIFEENKCCYGYRRIHSKLKTQGP